MYSENGNNCFNRISVGEKHEQTGEEQQQRVPVPFGRRTEEFDICDGGAGAHQNVPKPDEEYAQVCTEAVRGVFFLFNFLT